MQSTHPTELASALVHKKLHLQTPYEPAAWLKVLQQANLLKCFDMILVGMHLRSFVEYLIITIVQNLPKSTSISLYDSKLDEIVHKQIFKKEHILVPFPFQSQKRSWSLFSCLLCLQFPNQDTLKSSD